MDTAIALIFAAGGLALFFYRDRVGHLAQKRDEGLFGSRPSIYRERLPTVIGAFGLLWAGIILVGLVLAAI